MQVMPGPIPPSQVWTIPGQSKEKSVTVLVARRGSRRVTRAVCVGSLSGFFLTLPLHRPNPSARNGAGSHLTATTALRRWLEPGWRSGGGGGVA